jgi:hypothetical protein
MKKKLLSLLLVLCMVLPMVPVGVIVATAAETPTTHTTKYSENKPTFTIASGNGSTIDFNGNWDWVGHYRSDWLQSIILDVLRGRGSAWFETNLSVESFIASADTKGLEGSHTPVVRAGGPTGYWGEVGTFAANWEWNGGIRYIAEYTGTVTIDITKLSTLTPGKLGNGNYASRFAILVNGNMVWPKAGSYTNSGDWFPATEADILDEAKASEGYANLKNIKINKGDSIELLVKSGDGIYACRGNNMDMAVTYTSITGDPIVSRLETSGENWPVYTSSTDLSLKSDFTGGWGMAKHDAGVVTKLYYNPQFATYGNWDIGIMWLPRANSSGQSWYGSIARCNISNKATDFKTQGMGYTYDVAYAGNIDITTSFNVPSSDRLGGVYYSIVKIAPDGTEKVIYGDTTNAETEGAGVKYTTNGNKLETVKNVSVKAGEQLVFLFRAKNMTTEWSSPAFCTGFSATIRYANETANPTDTVSVYYTHPKTGKPVITQTTKGGTVVLPTYPAGYAFFGWDIDNDGEVDYKPGQSITVNADLELKPVLTGASDFYGCAPSYDHINKVVSYYGGWEAGAYDKYGNKFMPYTTLNEWDIFCHYGNAWETFGGLYMDHTFALSAKMGQGGNYWAQLQYTAPTAGTVSIELKELFGMKNANGAAETAMPLAFNFAIFKNGEQIWPAGDEWFAYEGQVSEINLLNVINEQFPGQFPMQESVNVGDTIEFRVEKGYASSRMIKMNPSVTYSTFETAPKVTATGVTVKETFTLNVYTHLNVARTDYVATGLKVWTSLADAEAMAAGYKALTAAATQDNTLEGAAMSDVTEIYNITGISAWELSKSFYVRTWVEYADGTVENGKVVEVSVADYAQNAIKATNTDSKLNRIATALLQYTIALDAYQGKNSGLTMPEKLPAMPVITPTNVYNKTTLEGGRVTLVGANLVLGETIDMTIDFTTDLPLKRANKLVVLMDDNASFVTPNQLKGVKISENDDGTITYRVTVTIKTADFHKPFYFKVMDHRGDVQSGVLTYSVESYVARQYEKNPFNTTLNTLLDAMLVLCKTANDAR